MPFKNENGMERRQNKFQRTNGWNNMEKMNISFVMLF